MRLIHTSDWHLGQTLHGQDRDFEHAAFLAWLLDTLVEQRADALLIAGDVFDTVNPPLRAQERLYDFIVSAHQRLPQLDIVMIAGNHDSGARIELPAPLLRRLNAHALGRVSWLGDGELDSARLLLPLHRAGGEIGAWCLALPFLRPAEVTGGGLGDDYLAGIARVHQQLIAAAEARRRADQALVAISHAHLAGTAVSEDSERNIVIGNAEALPASLFPESVAYVALGHLHKPQQVAGQTRLRYSGAPLPLSFAEVNYPHQVLLVELDGAGLHQVAALPCHARWRCCASARLRWPKCWSGSPPCPPPTAPASASPGWKCACSWNSRSPTCASRSRRRWRAKAAAWCASPANIAATAWKPPRWSASTSSTRRRCSVAAGRPSTARKPTPRCWPTSQRCCRTWN